MCSKEHSCCIICFVVQRIFYLDEHWWKMPPWCHLDVKLHVCVCISERCFQMTTCNMSPWTYLCGLIAVVQMKVPKEWLLPVLVLWLFVSIRMMDGCSCCCLLQRIYWRRALACVSVACFVVNVWSQKSSDGTDFFFFLSFAKQQFWMLWFVLLFKYLENWIFSPPTFLSMELLPWFNIFGHDNRLKSQACE